MLRVRTAEPCRGRGGAYEVWLHAVAPNAPNQIPRLVKVALTGDCADIDTQAGLSESPNPDEILELLQRFTVRGEGRIPRDQLATTSLIRMCDRATHISGLPKWTGKGMARPEAVTRMVWAPPGTGGRLPSFRATNRIEFDDENVGVVGIPGTDPVIHRRIVTVPVTLDEAGLANQRAVPVATTIEPALATFALLHLQSEGGPPIERVISPAS